MITKRNGELVGELTNFSFKDQFFYSIYVLNLVIVNLFYDNNVNTF